MAKSSSAKGMHGGKDKKTKGRTSITNTPGVPKPTSKPNLPRTLKTEANRPVEAGGGKQRGDRRDMSKTYSGTRTHASRGNNPRADVTTRKR